MKAKFPITSSRLIAIFACTFIFVLAEPSRATAQGCSLCRDTTAGSTPQARKALRIAIPLLGIPAVSIFAGALVLARKVKPGQQ
jgi:hypothetical protein